MHTAASCLVALPPLTSKACVYSQVELYWTKKGLLLPNYHKQYWMGAALGPDDNFPSYRWIDSTPGIPGQAYLHWGVPRGGVPEPDGSAGDQPCVLARASLSYQNLWGWADSDCEALAAAMCEIRREWLSLATCCCHALAQSGCLAYADGHDLTACFILSPPCSPPAVLLPLQADQQHLHPGHHQQGVRAG
jgi:hypothetical protein